GDPRQRVRGDRVVPAHAVRGRGRGVHLAARAIAGRRLYHAPARPALAGDLRGDRHLHQHVDADRRHHRASARQVGSELPQRPAGGHGGAHERGKVSEGPGACFFIVRDGALITAPVTSNILESITRETVLELGRDVLRLRVVEREIDRTEIYIADEAFFCGSGWEVTPVRSVDRYQIGKGQPGPLTRRLQEAYFSVAEGRVPQYRRWLTPVY